MKRNLIHTFARYLSLLGMLVGTLIVRYIFSVVNEKYGMPKPSLAKVAMVI